MAQLKDQMAQAETRRLLELEKMMDELQALTAEKEEADAHQELEIRLIQVAALHQSFMPCPTQRTHAIGHTACNSTRWLLARNLRGAPQLRPLQPGAPRSIFGPRPFHEAH